MKDSCERIATMVNPDCHRPCDAFAENIAKKLRERLSESQISKNGPTVVRPFFDILPIISYIFRQFQG